MLDLRNTNLFSSIDLFCGAGGVTEGMEDATYAGRKVCYVWGAINHSPIAIKTHAYNYPGVKHFVEDIVNKDVHDLPKVNIVWASIDCTHHSNAKGGASRKNDSRTLAWHLIKYVKQTDCDYLIVENVREFLKWGPLVQKIRDGKPLFDKNGDPVMVSDKTRLSEEYNAWVKAVEALGYTYEYRLLNSADFGESTSRLRYFGVFAKNGLPITFPKPTHDKLGRDGLLKWIPCKYKIDLEDEGKSVIYREKPLSPNTIARIDFGIEKFCLDEDEKQFLMSYYSKGHNTKSVNEPSNAITCRDGMTLMTVEVDEVKKKSFISQHIQVPCMLPILKSRWEQYLLRTKKCYHCLQA